MHWQSKIQQTQSTSLREQDSFESTNDHQVIDYSNSYRHSFNHGNQEPSDYTLKCQLTPKSLVIIVALLFLSLFFYQIWSEYKHAPIPAHPLNDYINSQAQSFPSSQTSNKAELKNDKSDDFDMNFVETQYEGKQTEEMLAKTAFLEMQKRFKIVHNEANEGEEKRRKKLLQDISSLDVMIPDQSLNDYVAQNYYFFSVSIHDLIMNSNLYLIYRQGQNIFKISLKQHMRAIIRTQLVHSVNYKGQIKVQLSPFDKGIEEKERAIKEIMEDEQLYYESFYQLSRYNHHQLRFCLLVPSYKNVKSRLYLRNLDSIFMQDYQNYHVVYIDDASPDQTGEYVKKYVQQRGIPQDKIQVFINDQNMKAMYNIYNGIHSYCPDGQVVGLIDGDDSLLGRKVLQLYNAVYQEKRPALIYSNFLKILTNNMTSFGFGTDLSSKLFELGILRNSMQLMGTHFMTFFSDLFKQIKKQDLCYPNGTFYDYAYDRAIITPMIEMAFPRVHYLAEITYEYRNDTGINDGTADWERVSRIILNNKPYKKIKDFSFIDDFVEETDRLRKEMEKKEGKATQSKIKPFIQDEEDDAEDIRQHQVKQLNKR